MSGSLPISAVQWTPLRSQKGASTHFLCERLKLGSARTACEKCFALWSFLHIFGSAPDLDVAFENEEGREAARNFMDLLGAFGRRGSRLITAGSREPAGQFPLTIRVSSRPVLNQVS